MPAPGKVSVLREWLEVDCPPGQRARLHDAVGCEELPHLEDVPWASFLIKDQNTGKLQQELIIVCFTGRLRKNRDYSI